MRKKKEIRYRITPKGLIEISEQKESIWDTLELYCYRHGYNAILVDQNGGEFIKVEKENKK